MQGSFGSHVGPGDSVRCGFSLVSIVRGPGQLSLCTMEK